MKKTLVFLLLVCLSLFTLTGCGKGVSTEKAATEDEKEDFFEDKLEELEEMFEDEISFSFKNVTKTETKEGADSSSNKTITEGRAIISYEDVEDSSFYVKETITEKSVEYGSQGKVKSSTKGTIETTLVNLILYVATDGTMKSGESVHKVDGKEKTDLEEASTNALINILGKVTKYANPESYFDGERVYIDGDKCLIVQSTSESHIETTLTFDGNTLVSVEIIEKAYGYESETTIKYGDVKEISKPKDASKYKSVEED